LDDVRNIPSPAWTLVRTLIEAKEFLESRNVENASLDHDLGPCPVCDIVEECNEGLMIVTEGVCTHGRTGYDLVIWMVETGHWPHNKPTVHSSNPVGAEAMRKTIDRYFPG
jgi:hypothetical protein